MLVDSLLPKAATRVLFGHQSLPFQWHLPQPYVSLALPRLTQIRTGWQLGFPRKQINQDRHLTLFPHHDSD